MSPKVNRLPKAITIARELIRCRSSIIGFYIPTFSVAPEPELFSSPDVRNMPRKKVYNEISIVGSKPREHDLTGRRSQWTMAIATRIRISLAIKHERAKEVAKSDELRTHVSLSPYSVHVS
jgi:hypothetical protein